MFIVISGAAAGLAIPTIVGGIPPGLEMPSDLASCKKKA